MTGVFLRCLSIAAGCLLIGLQMVWSAPAFAITAPELRGQRAVQDITADMHGLDLKEKEFLKADLREVDLSGTDLRGAVINTSQWRLICVVPILRMWWLCQPLRCGGSS